MDLGLWVCPEVVEARLAILLLISFISENKAGSHLSTVFTGEDK